MIQESFDRAEEDLRERQMREARVEADTILLATEKAQKNDAWLSLSSEERQSIEKAKQDIHAAYNGTDYRLLNERIETLNRATQSLAENMMNTAVRGALKGTKID